MEISWISTLKHTSTLETVERYLFTFFCGLALVHLLQKHETLLVDMAKLKQRVSDNTDKNCEARTPSMLKITKPFFGH